LNYSKLSSGVQGPNENPSAFLERLKEALIKHLYVTRLGGSVAGKITDQRE
jgi:hypothetical protein